jgi:hypothetical protein
MNAASGNKTTEILTQSYEELLLCSAKYTCIFLALSLSVLLYHGMVFAFFIM